MNSNQVVNGKPKSQVVVTSHDVPLSCPMPNDSAWDSHPKVFLPITDSGSASCPYCGTHYVMTDWHEGVSHH
jgi:uncharacterized Zn-finger protein